MTNPELHCPECAWKGNQAELASIQSAQERVSAGELMAAGQCPACGALVSVEDQDVPDYTLRAVAAIMSQRGWHVVPPLAATDPTIVLKDRIVADVAALRRVAAEPVAIRYGTQVSIEVRPLADDDRVSVLHDQRGFVVANYTTDGNAVEVDIADDVGDIVQSVVAGDLETSAAQ